MFREKRQAGKRNVLGAFRLPTPHAPSGVRTRPSVEKLLKSMRTLSGQTSTVNQRTATGKTWTASLPAIFGKMRARQTRLLAQKSSDDQARSAMTVPFRNLTRITVLLLAASPVINTASVKIRNGEIFRSGTSQSRHCSPANRQEAGMLHVRRDILNKSKKSMLCHDIFRPVESHRSTLVPASKGV